ncbi:ankyrin repeat-containing domain protein [Xylariaceae sp. FL0255]|nr:ankyrin repeat-containing domain protein [Xylariaceae sp. FL0255]
MSRSGTKPSEAQWREHKALIRRLYLVDERPLEEVVEKLATLNLHATTHQVEYKLKKWEIRKNIDKRAWVSIEHRINKRRRNGKKSEVILCGRRVKPTTIKKQTERHCDKSIFSQLGLQRSPSPVLSSDHQLTVCTPPSILMEFEWPNTLPWLKFSSQELPMLLKAWKTVAPKNLKIRSPNELWAIFQRSGQLQLGGPSLGVSKLAALIGRSMPETYPEEHLQRAQSLLNGPEDQFLDNYISMAIYNVSNNNMDLEFNDDAWEKTIATLQNWGIFRLTANLEKAKSSTIDGFMENLFNASILRLMREKCDNSGESVPMTIIRWLLSSGYCPTRGAVGLHRHLGTYGPHPCKVQECMLEIAETLFNAGADAKFLESDTIYGDLVAESILDDCEAVADKFAEILCRYASSQVIDQVLRYTIWTGKKTVTEIILQQRNNLEDELRGNALSKESVLSAAATIGLPQTQYILHLLSSENPDTPIATFITADVFIAAASQGMNDIICFLFGITHAIEPNEYGITPLHAAAKFGHLSTCELLFPLQSTGNRNATGEVTPLHIACYWGHEDVVTFLITAKIDVNAVATKSSERAQHQFRFLLDHSVGQASAVTPLKLACDHGQQKCAMILIHAGATLTGNETHFSVRWQSPELLAIALAAGADANKLFHYHLPGYTESALQIALADHSLSKSPSCMFEIANYLLIHGARLRGGEVARAVYLEHWELLYLLLRHGGSLTETDNNGLTGLAHAVLSHQTTLINGLVESDPTVYDAGALCAAITTENYSVIQILLLNRPISINIMDPLEVTALALAAESGNLNLVQSLLDHPPSCEWGPMFMYSTFYGDPWDLRRMDIEEGAKSSICLEGGPLSLVARQTSPKALEISLKLLKRGFRPDRLTWAMIANSNNLGFAQALLDHNQPYDHKYGDRDCPNPLLYAIENCSIEFVSLLLKAGVNANEQGDHWPSPLQLAVKYSCLDIVDRLVQGGADVNYHKRSEMDSRSPLQIAVENGNLDLVEYLVRAGADIDSPPAYDGGANPLQLAAIKGYLGLAKYLVDRGAQVNAPPAGWEGRTALQGAAEHGRLDMLEFLLANGAYTKDRWRCRFVKAVKLAAGESHLVAVGLLKQSAGWDEEDEILLHTVDANYDSGSDVDASDDDSSSCVSDSDGVSDFDDNDTDNELIGRHADLIREPLGDIPDAHDAEDNSADIDMDSYEDAGDDFDIRWFMDVTGADQELYLS